MRHVSIVVISLVFAATALPAQRFEDAFLYKPGPLPAPWTAKVGNWTATGTAVRTDAIATYHYATLARSYCRDCVVECVVAWNPRGLLTGTQRAGVIARAVNPANHDVWSAQLLNASGGVPRDFNMIMVWEQNRRGIGHGLSRNIPGGRLRFTIVDRRLRAQVDWDQDGRWDHTLNSTLYVYLPVQYGDVGLIGAGGALIDDVKIFDGVLIEAVNAPAPRPGGTLSLALRGFPSAFYVAAASLGNQGFALPPGRVPLRVDPLLLLSLSGGLAPYLKNAQGRIDSNGDATLQVTIPPLPALVGTTAYVAFITHGNNTILNYSNDLEITVQP